MNARNVSLLVIVDNLKYEDLTNLQALKHLTYQFERTHYQDLKSKNGKLLNTCVGTYSMISIHIIITKCIATCSRTNIVSWFKGIVETYRYVHILHR